MSTDVIQLRRSGREFRDRIIPSVYNFPVMSQKNRTRLWLSAWGLACHQWSPPLDKGPLTDLELYREMAMIWNTLGNAADPHVTVMM